MTTSPVQSDDAISRGGSPADDGLLPRPKYWAFISYSSKDRSWGEWLSTSLEKYRVPRSLVGLKTASGVVPRRLFPVFRDRDELRAGADVKAAIEQALLDSGFLVVVCSPHAANPDSWVGREVAMFKASGRQERVLALIVDGEPNASRTGDAGQECFPESLRFRVDDAGHLTKEPAEPLAADVRRDGATPRNARRRALLKLIARLIDVDFDTLEQRDRRRNRQRMALYSAALAGVALVVTVLSSMLLSESRAALSQRIAHRARDQIEAHPDVALLTSVLAYRVAPTPAAHASVLAALEWNPNLRGYLRGTGKVLALAFDESETWLAIATCTDACSETAVALYDTRTLEPVAPPFSIAGAVTALRFKGKSKQLMIASGAAGSARLALFDPMSAKEVRKLYTTPCCITGLDVSRDGSLFAVVAGSPPEFKLFDARGRRCGEILDVPASLVTFSADGRRLALAWDGVVVAFELEPGSCRETRKFGPDQPSDIAFDPASTRLYVAAKDGTIWSFGLDSETQTQRFNLVEYSPEGYLHVFDRHARRLFSKHADHLRVYDLEARRRIMHELEHDTPDPVRESMVRLGLEKLELARLRSVVAERVAVSAAGNLAATADGQGTVAVWTTKPQRVVTSSVAETEAARGADEATSPDGQLVARARTRSDACSGDSKVRCRVWTELSLAHAGTGLEIARLAGVEGDNFTAAEPISVAFAGDGSLTTRRGFLVERWVVDPEALVARACRQANRSLTSAEISGYFQTPWHRFLRPKTLCPRR